MIASLALAVFCAAPSNAQFVRPRDPFAFRCVLDERARMVVLALNTEMWAAYDATHGSLYRAWKGDVQLQGAVFDTVHGPQPVARGTDYARGMGGPVWYVEEAGVVEPMDFVWRGYAIRDGQAVLKYEGRRAGKPPIRIEETPECVFTDENFRRTLRLEAGLVGLARSFRVEGAGEAKVLLRDRPLSAKQWPQNVRGMRAELRVGERAVPGPFVELAGDTETILRYYFDQLPDFDPEEEADAADNKEDGQ